MSYVEKFISYRILFFKIFSRIIDTSIQKNRNRGSQSYKIVAVKASAINL